MRVTSSIDGAVGTVRETVNGRVCVEVGDEVEWWTTANTSEVPELDLASITPEQAAELLRRLQDATV